MLRKVYIGPLNDNRDEIKTSFSNVVFVNCDKINTHDLYNYHRLNLLNKKQLSCLYNLHKVDSNILLNILKCKIDSDVVWCFEKLAKNTKIYKTINTVTSIDYFKPENIDKRDKKTYINSYMLNNKIDVKYVKLFQDKDIPTRSLLKNECEKLKNALNVLEYDQLHKVILDYSSDTSVLNFISEMFSNNLVSIYRLIDKVSINNTQAVSCVLLKKFYFLY